jgi:hypothetical protein
VEANKLRARLYRCKLKLEREGKRPCKYYGDQSGTECYGNQLGTECYGDQLVTECLHSKPSNKPNPTR